MLRVKFQPASLITIFFLAVFLVATVHGWEWPYIAKLMPVYFAAIPGIVLCLLELYRYLIGWEQRNGGEQGGIEMDEVFRGGLDRRTELGRTLVFFSWFAGGAVGIWLLGITIALPLLVLAYALVEGREKWLVSLLLVGGTFLFLWGLLGYILGSRWPEGILFR